MSCDPISSSCDLTDVGIAVSMEAESALLNWIPVNRPNEMRCGCQKKSTEAPLSVNHVFSCSHWLQPPEAKDDFYRELFRLLRNARFKDVVVTGSDFAAHLDYFEETEWQTGGGVSVPVDQTENGDIILQV